MTGKWMGALLASVAMLAPVTVQAQEMAASAAIVANVGQDATTDTANQSDRGDRRGGGWGGRGGGGRGNGQGNAQAPTAQPSSHSAPQWQGRRGGGNGYGGGQATAPAPDQAPRWQGRRGGGNWNGGGQVNAPTAPTADQAPRWQGRRGGGNDNDRNWQQRDRGQPPVVAPQAPRRDPSADGWRGQRWQGDNRGDVNNRGRYDGSQWDRNRDGEVDRRWDRNDNGRVDRRYNRDRDGRNDRYDRYDNRRNYGRSDYGRGQWNNRWRDDRRYDWRSYRDRNASQFRLGRYYSPYNNWSYRRLSIGFSLWPLFYSDRYWINDPSYYSLPDVYGPYRWVRYYDDALLVDVQSGEVVDVINNFFW